MGIPAPNHCIYNKLKMKKFKSRLLIKEKLIITEMVQEIPDYYSDFYITKNNLRLFLKDNLSLFFDSLKQGDKIAYNKEGIIFVTGFADKANRKYIKFLVKNNQIADNLLKIINWNLKVDLWCKIKKNNPLLDILKNNGFNFFADRGKECLIYKPVKIK